MAEETDKYKTITKTSEGFYKEKGSKFYAFAYPVTTEQEIKELRQKMRKKYYDARHHVYAFRLGANLKIFRSSDDGEPSNSSGPPILGQIQSNGLTNILIVVIRYFGGTKLGIPGLINAYRTAAADAIANNTIVEQFEQDIFIIEFSYTAMNSVMKIIKEEKPKQSNQQFDNTCKITISVRKQNGNKLKEKFKKIDGLAING